LPAPAAPSRSSPKIAEERHGIVIMPWSDKAEWILETSGARFRSPRLVELAP
jgi:hypothetical protein